MKTDIKKSLQISDKLHSRYKDIWGNNEDTKKKILKVLDSYIFEYIDEDLEEATEEELAFSLERNKSLRSIKKWFKTHLSLESIENILDEAIVNEIENSKVDKIEILWGRLTKTHRYWGEDFVGDIEAESFFIQEVEKQVVFPAYKNLVSKPSSSNWHADTHEYRYTGKKRFSNSRKAELLLIGEFEWNGLLIAKSEPLGVKDKIGWIVNLDPDYKPSGNYKDLWQSTITQIEGLEGLRKAVTGLFKPFKNSKRTMPLANYLYKAKLDNPEEVRAVFLDFNKYNLEETNIDFVSNKGAVMKCSRCRRPVSTKNSQVIAKERACVECLDGKYSSEIVAIGKS